MVNNFKKKWQKMLRNIGNKIPINTFRYGLYRLSDVKIGHNVEVRSGAKIGRYVTIGNNVTIGANSLLNHVLVGNNSMIEYGVILLGNEENPIKIGKHAYIGIYAVLEGFGGLVIGDYVHIGGPSVGIWTHTSVYQCLRGDKLDDHTHRMVAPIKIENNVWIGGKVTVYPNVTIGHHSVILPNSVVNENIPPYSMVGGIPAEHKKKIEIKGDIIEFV